MTLIMNLIERLRSIRSKSNQEGLKFVSPEAGLVFVPPKESPRGRIRVGRVGALLLFVLTAGGVALSPAGPAVANFIKGQVNEIIAKDNEVVRQTDEMYRTPEFKASIERSLNK